MTKLIWTETNDMLEAATEDGRYLIISNPALGLPHCLYFAPTGTRVDKWRAMANAATTKLLKLAAAGDYAKRVGTNV